MQIIDLTHPMGDGMPVYPGTEPPQFLEGSRYDRDGFRETILRMHSHSGTHMDAPNHIFPSGKTLDAFPVSQFVGTAVVLDCSAKQAGEAITMQDLVAEWEAVKKADFLLIHTGWSHLWGQPAYFENYPCLDFEVLDYLIRAQKKGVGLDVVGLDPVSDTSLARHKRLFETGELVVIENLINLDQVGRGLFTFFALPLKFEKADGAPVRAIACLPGK